MISAILNCTLYLTDLFLLLLFLVWGNVVKPGRSSDNLDAEGFFGHAAVL